MAAKIFLGLNVLLWLPYGLYLFAWPGALAEMGGVAAQNPTGTTELRAMYGGLQMGIGVLCGLGLVRAGWAVTAVGALSVLAGGLGTTRLAGAVIDGSFTQYTLGAIALEFSLAALGTWLLSSGRVSEL